MNSLLFNPYSFLLFFVFLDERLEEGVGRQDMGVAGDNHLFARASDGDIELAVDDVAVFLETVAGEEVELVAVLDGERIDDDVALAALVALDSIDGHLFDAFDTEAVDFLADHGYLVAVGHDDAYGLGGVETVGVVVADVA